MIVGSTNSITAPSPQTLARRHYGFVSWSDGGARAHDIVAPATSTTYTASYEAIVGPPQTTITSGPQGPTPSSSPSFEFGSDRPGSTFQCRLDSGAWQACGSPKSYSGLPDGPHTFEVRAIGPDLQTDPSPASRSFGVDTKVAGGVGAKATQRRAGRGIYVRVKLIAREKLRAEVKGSVELAEDTVQLRPRRMMLPAGAGEALKLRPRWANARREVAEALQRRRRVTARVRVKLTDALGNTATRRVRVKLAR